MNRYVLTALLCPLLGTHATAQVLPSSRASHRVGAYVLTATDTPEVQEAKAFIQGHLASINVDEITEAYTQVVAGLNVKLICKVSGEDGPSEWQFVAYRSLDGRWHLWAADRI